MITIKNLYGNVDSGSITMQQTRESLHITIEDEYLSTFANFLTFSKENNEALFYHFEKAYKEFLNLFEGEDIYTKYPCLRRGEYIYNEKYILPSNIRFHEMFINNKHYSAPCLNWRSSQIIHSYSLDKTIYPYSSDKIRTISPSFGFINYGDEYIDFVLKGYFEKNKKKFECIITPSDEISEIYNILSLLIFSLETSDIFTTINPALITQKDGPIKTYCIKR